MLAMGKSFGKLPCRMYTQMYLSEYREQVIIPLTIWQKCLYNKNVTMKGSACAKALKE